MSQSYGCGDHGHQRQPGFLNLMPSTSQPYGSLKQEDQPGIKAAPRPARSIPDLGNYNTEKLKGRAAIETSPRHLRDISETSPRHLRDIDHVAII
ncbi:MAG: hypothetical protein MPK62_15240 [Alphaproteobacteria bacterium]|nr:hypothetical protein [Alphaproteobacteria bacterium]